MRRPTIRQIAVSSGVSVATVNRYFAGSPSLRPHVRASIEQAIASLMPPRMGAAAPRVCRLGFVLPPAAKLYGHAFADAVRQAAASYAVGSLEIRVEHAAVGRTYSAAELVREMSNHCDAISVTAAVHSSLTEAIQEALAKEIVTVATGMPLNDSAELDYIGVDHWKVGRMAAWALDGFKSSEGTIGLFLGSPRYRDEETNESGFRSYFREYATHSTVNAFGTSDCGEAVEGAVENFLASSDFAALYVASGPLQAILSAAKKTRHDKMTVISFDTLENARDHLIDGSLTMNIAPPLQQLAKLTVDHLVDCVRKRERSLTSCIVPFETYISENI